MWVTQTYLGAVEPDAKVFVYYFFEDYNKQQKTFTNRVQRELERLGELFGDQVTLLTPNPRYADRIEAQVRENRELWAAVRNKLPGLFLTTVPLADLTSQHDGAVFIPFVTRAPADVAKTIQEVRRLVGDTVAWEHAHQQPPVRRSLGDRFLDAFELKPGIWGIRLDLRKLAGR